MSDIFDLFKKIESGNGSNSVTPITHIIAGLGNPGSEYDMTRHNAGFITVDKLADKYNKVINRAKFKALTADVVIGDKHILLMKPQTYMNLSGEAIKEAVDFYKITPENILVICDDVSFDVGKMRIRRSGSAGGHNGLKNIILNLGTDSFPRIKIGVGIMPKNGDMVNWVLGKIPKEQHEALFETAEKAADACGLILNGDIEKAMCNYN